jgi:hypothetical protein
MLFTSQSQIIKRIRRNNLSRKSKSKRPDRNSIQLNYSGLPKAIETSKDTDFIYIGSTFVVAEIL